MRVTADTKQETRRRILESARKLFSERGFELTTTRDISGSAGVAAGTLYNYFPTKEALAMTLIAEALGEAEDDFVRARRGEESLEELLFAFVHAGLRRLSVHRRYLGEVLETAWSPFAGRAAGSEPDELRLRHLESVKRLIESSRAAAAPTPSDLAVHLYWTLYLGVLSFWVHDPSPNQEFTLVVLDQSMRLFAASLAAEPTPTKEACDVPESR